MKKKEIAKLILFPLILCGSILGLNFGLFQKVSDDLNSYSHFYKEQENSLDVVLMGNSTIREGYIPTQMWKEYGITSRGFSSSPTHPEVIYLAIDEVIRVQHPDIVFIDLTGLTYQKRIDADFFVAQYYKALPEGEHKDKVKEAHPFLNDQKDKFELFKNHNNFRQQQYWESLVYPDQFKTKGYQPNKIISAVKPVELEDDKLLPLNEDGEYYFEKIMEKCREYQENTRFIFGKMPKYNDILGGEAFRECEYMFRTIEERLKDTDFGYMNFSNVLEEIGLNPKTDFKDNDHLNHLGAIKFTHYYGQYLLDNSLKIKNKTEEVKNDFDEAYLKTKDYLDGITKKLTKKI